jgi:pimeloyl-ACP methyl ester carboxylesterase
MIGTSLGEWILIQVSILFFRYTPLIYAIALTTLHFLHGAYAATLTLTKTLWCLLLAEIAFYCTIYRPYTQKPVPKALHPKQLSYQERQKLFQQCFHIISDLKAYIHWWFLGAELDAIHRVNLEEFLLWAFFETDLEGLPTDSDERDAIYEEIGGYVASIEGTLNHRFPAGRGAVKSLRLTLDDIETTYRSLLWYTVVFALDIFTHAALACHGFQFHGRSRSSAAATFPPRPQEVLGCRRSPEPGMSYWYREHRATNKPPIVFFHGIGLGLLIYIRFLIDLYAAKTADGDVGIIAVELLPVTFRLTTQPYQKREVLQQVSGILQHHQWPEFSVVSHSFGSVPTTHMLQTPALRERICSVVLVDPVTILLHLPNVAYNFTRRRPREANEWQLWYFASTDPQVARCLGRHFFWRENILWKEELMTLKSAEQGRNKDRVHSVTVCLAGKDIIVDTAAVAGYLAEDASSERGGVNVVLFPKLDHAQVFDSPSNYKEIIDCVVESGGRRVT